MRFVVNTRLLRKNALDGIGWFTYNTLKYIVEKHPEIEFHFLFDSGIDNEFVFGKNVIPHNLFPPAKHALLNIIWFEWSVRRILEKLHPDLFISPDGLLCLGWDGKQYGVMHDINYFHHPQDLKWSNQKYYNYFFPKFARKAVRIGTVSQYSKTDIVKHYHIDPHKIDVLYNGVNTFFRPLCTIEKEQTKAELTGGADYFIFIGTLHPRKNIIRLLQAFDQFRSRIPTPVKLVIAGKGMYKVDEIYQQHQLMVNRNEVVFTGRVEDNRINAILGAALGLVFVPSFEGFGIPIIEAMQCEVPVICSNTTSMPEVAGDAALLVDPFNINAIADAMLRIYSQPGLRKELVEKGNQRKQLFTWEKTADLLWASISKCF
jgi:glycosyltransferase involved in cell wall biosynthesis